MEVTEAKVAQDTNDLKIKDCIMYMSFGCFCLRIIKVCLNNASNCCSISYFSMTLDIFPVFVSDPP